MVALARFRACLPAPLNTLPPRVTWANDSPLRQMMCNDRSLYRPVERPLYTPALQRGCAHATAPTGRPTGVSRYTSFDERPSAVTLFDDERPPVADTLLKSRSVRIDTCLGEGGSFPPPVANGTGDNLLRPVLREDYYRSFASWGYGSPTRRAICLAGHP